ncbi:MAG: Ig-like domain-containing protein [Gemmatimonas sp.]
MSTFSSHGTERRTVRTATAPAALTGLFSLLLLAVSCGGSDGPTGPPAIATITIAPTAPIVLQSDTVRLKSELKSSNGTVLTDRTVTWTSASPAVATVNSTTGLITGVALGTSLITATSEGKTATVTVTVKLDPCDLSVALPIVSGVPITGTLAATDCPVFDDGTFADLFTFTLDAQNTLDVKMHSTVFDAYIEIYRVTGSTFTRVGSNDDADASTTDARLTGTLSAAQYLIIANGFNVSSTNTLIAAFGDYLVTFTSPFTAALRTQSMFEAEPGAVVLQRLSPADARNTIRALRRQQPR